jgi:endonuclease YncB( thermonuclease family)
MKGCRSRARTALLKFAASLCALLISIAHADERDFSGIVTKVFDGDSFVVLPIDRTHRGHDIEVRLMDIDAPEKDQPYADAARGALKQLIEGRRVFVDVIEVDRYERKVAKVYREPDRLEVARALVHDGHVWVNRKYAKDLSLVRIEDTAKSKRIGLWALPADERVPPWQFRVQTKGENGRKKTQKAQTKNEG